VPQPAAACQDVMSVAIPARRIVRSIAVLPVR
jgi:hypothetical protein